LNPLDWFRLEQLAKRPFAQLFDYFEISFDSFRKDGTAEDLCQYRPKNLFNIETKKQSSGL